MTDMRKNNNTMRVDNHGEGCATIVLLYTYTESVKEKKYDEEGENGGGGGKV